MISLLLFFTNVSFAQNKHQCLYKDCCLHYIAAETRRGRIRGVKAFLYRFKRCRPGYLLFRNPLINNPEVLLVTGEVLNKDMIADHILDP